MSRLRKDYAERSYVVRIRGIKPSERSVCCNRLAEIPGCLFSSRAIEPRPVAGRIKSNVPFKARGGLSKFSAVPMIIRKFFVLLRGRLESPKVFSLLEFRTGLPPYAHPR